MLAYSKHDDEYLHCTSQHKAEHEMQVILQASNMHCRKKLLRWLCYSNEVEVSLILNPAPNLCSDFVEKNK